MITVTSDYVIRYGQTVNLSATTAFDYADLYPGIVYDTTQNAASFTDGGAVNVTGSFGVVAGLYLQNYQSFNPAGAFVFQATSVFHVVSNNNDASAETFGFFSPHQTVQFDNEGLLEVDAANGLAVGVYLTENGGRTAADLTMTNGGQIEVTSGADAVGVQIEPPGSTPFAYTWRNAGSIDAQGEQSAIGLDLQLSDGMQVFNSGAISASTGPDAANTSIGIEIDTQSPYVGFFGGTPFNDRGSYIENSGDITADRAVYVFDGIAAAEMVVNSGTIHGDIDLDRGADRLINTGSIVGSVTLGSGRDLMVALAGHQVGPVDGGEGDDILIGGALGETLLGSGGHDQISGGGGDDWIDGGRDADALSGGAGWDTVYYANSTRGIVADLSKGKVTAWSVDAVQGFEHLVATVYGDKVTGGRIAERLEGIAGDDTLSGGAGADTLVGGSGTDRLSGGLGGDTFVFGRGSGADVVTDFDGRSDHLEIHGYTGFSGLTQQGSDLLVSLGGGDQILLLNTTAAALANGDHTVFSADLLPAEVQRQPDSGWVIDGAGHVRSGEVVDLLVPDAPKYIHGGAAEIGVTMEWGPDFPATLWNQGTIHVEGDTPGWRYDYLVGIGLGGSDPLTDPILPYGKTQQFVNGVDATVEVINDSNGQVFGVRSAAIAYAFNSGTISAEGKADAIGFAGVGLVNGGAIRAVSQSGSAYGVSVGPSSFDLGDSQDIGFWNSGDITASGHRASTGVQDALATFVNTGRITVTDATTAMDSVGIQGTGRIWNSGVVTADLSVTGVNVTLFNSGVLNGAIQLDKESHVRNTGEINGDVSLGEFDSVFDSRGGSVSGTVFGLGGADLLIGSDSDDRLNGAGGLSSTGQDLDTLWGGRGDDTLSGGRDWDTFAFAAGDGHDVITDFDYGKRDDVIALVGMRSYLSIEQVGADTLIRLTANDDVLLKNFDASKLKADNFEFNAAPPDPSGDVHKTPKAPTAPHLGGTDTTPGQIGALQGTSAADTLDGSHGQTVMIGGAGNDTYLVDDSHDVAVEQSGGGDDLVISSAKSYHLDQEVESLTLQGSARIGFGNAWNNHLTGSAGANILEGLAGNDTLVGGAGDDTLYGGIGNDVLDGGAGRDVMYGGGSYERWVFHPGDTGNDAASADVIADFVEGEFIDVSGLRGAGSPFTWLGKGAFTGHAGELRYDQSGQTDTIQGDLDGDGHSDFMIVLKPLYNEIIDLRAHDFVL